MKVRIYQINKVLDSENTLFMGFDYAENHGGVAHRLIGAFSMEA